MKNIGFFPNLEKDSDLSLTNKLIDYVCSLGATSFANIGFMGRIKNKTAVFCENIFMKSDFVIVLGGDGTMLDAAKHAAVQGVPLLGVNLGNLGYLTDTDKSGAETVIADAINGNYTLENRMMLAIKDTDSGKNLIALNDICFLKAAPSRLVEFELFINNDYINKYRADGIIISTPTGSTAYNLSAGGPMAKPDARMIIVTPVSAHNLFARPFVISPDDEVMVKSIGSKSSPLIVSADGRDLFTVYPGNTVTVYRPEFITKIMKIRNRGFYDTARQKLL